MTILPKKKHIEAKKVDPEYEGRVRPRSTRERSRNTEDLGSDICAGGTNTSPKCEYSDSRKSHFETQDTGSTSYKRNRHRSTTAGTYHMGATEKNRNSYRRQSDDEQEETGYNSSDEYGPQEYDPDLEQKETDFEKLLQETKGYTIKKMAEDGACLFRAVADQIYGDQEMHSQVRGHCMDYMVKNSDYFSQYITEDFTSYITRKRDESCHGNHPELQALSELYNRPIEVYKYSVEPINTFWNSSSCNPTDNPPIRLSYHGNVHYNSVVDPYNATIGVGLGLAGYKPGLADRMMMTSAKSISEQHLIEEEMLEDKRKATDWEATDEEMTEQIARESYLEWLRETQKRHPAAALPGPSSSKPSTSSQSKRSPPRDPASPLPCASHSAKQLKSSSPPRRRSPSPSVSRDNQDVDYRYRSERGSENRVGGAEALAWEDFPMEYLSEGDLGNLEEDRILAAVLAESQKEYFENIARDRNIKDGDSTG